MGESTGDEAPESRRRRVRTVVAHRPMLFGAPLIAVAIVAGFSDARESTIVSLGAVVVFIVVQLMTLAHDGGLCLRCIAEIPADPARAIALRRPLLRLFHGATTGRGIAVLVLIATVGVTAGLLVRPGWGDLVLILPLATMALTVMHRRVEPWCPFCGWGRGDDDEHAPDPMPDPDTAASLTR